MANNKPRNTERDAAMIADFEAGMNKTQIAAKNGVSRQRAAKIINTHQSREMALWQAQNEFLLERIERLNEPGNIIDPGFTQDMTVEEIYDRMKAMTSSLKSSEGDAQ